MSNIAWIIVLLLVVVVVSGVVGGWAFHEGIEGGMRYGSLYTR